MVSFDISDYPMAALSEQNFVKARVSTTLTEKVVGKLSINNNNNKKRK